MNVESDFSTMKSAELSTKLGCEIYNALRLFKSFFRKDIFENFNIPSELLQLVKNASSKYKEECEFPKARNQRVESEVTVFVTNSIYTNVAFELNHVNLTES